MTKAVVALAVPAEYAQAQRRICSICTQAKPLDDFVKERRSSTGRAARCKACAAAKTRAYNAANPQRVAQNKRARYAENIEANRARDRERYSARAERQRENARLWYAANREKVLARMSSPEGREYSRNAMRKKLANPADKLHSNVSRAIRASVKDKGRRSWEQLVGYSLNDLIVHIEKQFTSGMTWQSHGRGRGKWHIDHIIPRSLFAFSSASDPEFKACWALPNLRPMWSEQNISKHAKRLYLL